MEEGRSAFKILTGTPAGKRPLGRPRRRWEENIGMYLKEICINTRNWVDSAQGLLECSCECGIEPPGSISHGISSIVSYLFSTRGRVHRLMSQLDRN